MKIAQVAAALPSLTPAVARVAEGAMLFELPVASDDSGPGDGAAASDHDATDPDQPARNLMVTDVSAETGQNIVDGAVARQMPSLPLALLPLLVARPQTSVPVVVPADTHAVTEGSRAGPAAESVALTPSISRAAAATSGGGPTSVTEAEADGPRQVVEQPDPSARAGATPTKIATGAPFAPESIRVLAAEASTVPQAVATSIAPKTVVEMPIHPPRDTIRTASAIPPADVRSVEQGAAALPGRVAALPTPFLSASRLPTDTLVQPKLPDTPLPQPAVGGGAAYPESARRVVGEQITARPVRTTREILEATPTLPSIGQAVASLTPMANRTESAPVDPRIASRRMEPVVAERQSNEALTLDPSVDTPPVSIVRQMGGEAASKSTSSGPAGSPKLRQIDRVSYPTDPAAPQIGEPTRPSGRESDPVGGRTAWQSGHLDIDAVAAPAEPASVPGAPILSGMTRSADVVAATPLATQPILDVDAGGQWIDRLAVEISACAASGGMRLKLSPDNLGELSIAVSSGDSGASVVITAQDESVRSAIAGAQDRLMAEARAQGVRVADVQTGLAGEGGTGTQQHMRQSPQPAIPDSYNQPKRTMPIEVANHERANPAGRWA